MKFKKGWQPVSTEGFSEACPICKNNGSDLCFECKMEIGKSGFEPKDGFEPTNADHIRAMSDEELADMLDSFNACNRCRRMGNDCFPASNTLEWLKQPAEVEE